MKGTNAVCWIVLCCVATLAVPVSAQVRDWPSQRPPGSLPAKPAPFPPYEVRSLSNGLQVVVVRQDEQPIVSVQMLIKAGAACDPAGKTGVAGLVASMLGQGTTSRTARDMADAVDTAGAELTVTAGSDASFAQITVLKDRLGFGLDMLSDVVRNPAFADEELEKRRQQLRAELRVNYDDPGYLASMVFGRLVFGNHPYGVPADGTPESVARITRADLVDYHRRYFVPNNTILAIVGDVDVPGAFAASERVFGTWERSFVVLPPMEPPPAPKQRVVLVDVPRATQSVFRLGHLGVARNSRDFPGVDVGVRILGGVGSHRLQQALASARVFAVGASADLDTYRTSGILWADADTHPDFIGATLRLIVDAFGKFQRDTVTEQELELAKSYVAGSSALGLETPGSISTRVLTRLSDELSLDDVHQYRNAVAALTPAAVHEAMLAHLHPDQLTIVVVGPAASLATQLASSGFKDVDVIPIEQLDLSAASLRRDAPAKPQAGAVAAGVSTSRLASREDWAAVRAVLERAAEAAGGLPTLRGVKTLSATAQTVLYTPSGPIRAVTKTLVAYPDRFRTDAVTPGGALIQTYNAGEAWIWEPRGARDAPPMMRREFALGVRRDWIRLLLDGLDERLTGRRIGDEKGLAGKPLAVVELWDDELPPVRVAIDAATGRLVRMSYQAPGPTGPDTVTETYSDFRLVSGVQIPFKAVTRRENVPLLERTVTDLLINPLLRAGTFDKPK